MQNAYTLHHVVVGVLVAAAADLRCWVGWAAGPEAGVFLACHPEGNQEEYCSNHRRSYRWNHHVRSSEPCNRSRFEENNPTQSPRKQRQQRVVVAKDGDDWSSTLPGCLPDDTRER